MSPPTSERDPIWVESKLTAEELNGQAIEFRLPLKGGGIVHGIGQLSARTRKVVDHRIAVQIHACATAERANFDSVQTLAQTHSLHHYANRARSFRADGKFT